VEFIMKSQEYRSKAVECLESAPWISDAAAKNTLIEMALYWLRLADLHEANRGLDGVIDRTVGTGAGVRRSSGI
jgi:hypothetical protein